MVTSGYMAQVSQLVSFWHLWDVRAGWDRVRFLGETGHRSAIQWGPSL